MRDDREEPGIDFSWITAIKAELMIHQKDSLFTFFFFRAFEGHEKE